MASKLPILSDKGIESLLTKEYYDLKLKQNFNFLKTEDEDSKGASESEEEKSDKTNKAEENALFKPTFSRTVKSLKVKESNLDPDYVSMSDFIPFYKPEYQLMYCT